MKTWRLRCDEFLPMTTTSASDGTSLPRFSEVKLKARLFVRACLCCKIVRQQNLRWSVKFVSSDYPKDMVGKCCDILPVVWGLWWGEQHISCWAPSSWQRLTRMPKVAKQVDGAANPNPNWAGTGLAASYEVAPNSRATAPHILPTNALKVGLEKKAANTKMYHLQFIAFV